MADRAVFLDRDGTLIEDPGYLNDPALVRLRPGAAAALAGLKSAGFRLIVVTNQSGIARGLITPAQYLAVASRTAELLSEGGGRPDAQYHCPHLPELSGACDCRKPGLLLFQQAIEAWKIDPTASWWIGDRLGDVLPARVMGGRGVLLASNSADEAAAEAKAAGIVVQRKLSDAAEWILNAPSGG